MSRDDQSGGEALVGGGDSGPILRIGDTVRRPVRPWTQSVHLLLRHLEQSGFQHAPRVIGIDEVNREVLTYVPGEDGRVARCYEDQALVEVATIVRRLHDMASSFLPPTGSHWRTDPHAPVGRLLCHNDLSPANTIFQDGHPAAFIDWDFATPTTALWDLSYAVRTFVPLYSPDDCSRMGYPADQQAHRLALFCEAYGMDAQMRAELLPMVMERLLSQGTSFAERCRQTLRAQWTSWHRAVTA